MSRAGVAAARVERARRRAETLAAVLLVALLPMLTFFGHWELRFDLPGTLYFFSWPTDSGAGRGDPGASHDHAGHCHGELASCTNSPATAAAPVALLGSELAIDAAGAPLLAALVDAWQPTAVNNVAPDTPPPRHA